jgi:hypothetical protein
METALIYMRALHTDHGIAPAYYLEVHPEDLSLWVADGAEDVSDDPKAWETHHRAVDGYNQSLL